MEVIYFAVDGKEPVREWLEYLDEIVKLKIMRRIEKIEDHGHLGDFKSLDQGVCELRIDFGPGYRVYFARDGKEIILLLHGGTKKRQQSDIDKAIEYWKIYKEEKHGSRK